MLLPVVRALPGLQDSSSNKSDTEEERSERRKVPQDFEVGRLSIWAVVVEGNN